METVGSSGRLRSLAQNWAIDIESAPRSSKKWLSTGTMSILRTSASTAAMPAAAPPGAGRVGAEVVEEVAVGRDAADLEDLGEHGGQLSRLPGPRLPGVRAGSARRRLP